MANRLTKTKTLDLLSEAFPGRPASPGVAYRAPTAYWVQVTVTFRHATTLPFSQRPRTSDTPAGIQWRYSMNAAELFTLNEYFKSLAKAGQTEGDYGPLDPPDTGKRISTNNLTTSPDTETRWVLVSTPEIQAVAPRPAIPASAAQFRANFNLGWNSGARSALIYAGDMELSFSVPSSSTGVVVGLSPQSEDASQRANEIAFGWRVSNGQASVVEHGAVKAGPFTVSSSAVLKVKRVGEDIEYYTDATLRHTSAGVSSSYHLIVDSSLYAATDAIVDAAVSGGTSPATGTPSTGEMAAATPPWTMTGTDGTLVGRMSGATPPWTMTGTDDEFIPAFGIGYAATPPWTMSGFSPAAVLTASTEGHMATPPWTMVGTDGTLVGRMSGATPPWTMLGVDGEMTFPSVGIAMPMGKLLGGGAPGVGIRMPMGRLSATGLQSISFAWPMGRLSVNGSSSIQFQWPMGRLVATAGQPSGPSVSVSMPLGVLSSAPPMRIEFAMGALSSANPMRIAMPLGVLLASASAQASAEAAQAWATNLATGETTRWTGFSFKRIARIGGKTYGLSSDGLSLREIVGDFDGTAPVAWSIETNPHDFGTMFLKRVPWVMVGADTQVTVTAYAQTGGDTHKSGPFESSMGRSRTTMAAGLAGRYWSFKIQHGKASRLDGVWPTLTILTRRV